MGSVERSDGEPETTRQSALAVPAEAAPEPGRGQLRADAKTRPGVAEGEQTVYDRVAELERQLAEAQAKLEQQRELGRASQRRWRERHPEVARERNAAYKRKSRARRREQGSQAPAVQ